MNLTGQPAYVGRHCGSSRYEVGKEIVAFYQDALDDHSDLYAQWAPPLLYHSECYKFVGEWYLKNLFGNLHMQQDWKLFAAIPVGGTVATRSTIIDRFQKRGRDIVLNETDIIDASDGRLLVRGHTHQSFLPPKDDTRGDGFVVDEKAAARKTVKAERKKQQFWERDPTWRRGCRKLPSRTPLSLPERRMLWPAACLLTTRWAESRSKASMGPQKSGRCSPSGRPRAGSRPCTPVRSRHWSAATKRWRC